MKLSTHSRKGSTIIPAVFLLLFILIFGAALVKGVLLSTNFSTRTLEKRQAHLLAESATNYICDALAGTQTEELFISIDTILEAISVNTIVETDVEIDGTNVDSSVKLLSRVTLGNKTYDRYKITSVATQGTISQKISREMNAERTKGGLGDLSASGIFIGREKARYSIIGPSKNDPAEIIGSVRFENVEDMIMNNLRVKGDLFVRGDLANGAGINLANVEVEKNLYIENNSPHISSPVLLTNITVRGETVINTSAPLSLSGIISTQNMYIKTSSTIVDSGMNNSYIDNLYIHSPTIPSQNLINICGGTIHLGADADTAVFDRLRPVIIDPNLPIEIIPPGKYDFELDSDNNWDWSEVDINLAAQPVYNILYDAKHNSMDGTINISGSGAVNIFIKTPANQTVLLNGFSVNRSPSSTGAVNIICLEAKAYLQYTDQAAALEANLIAPKGTIYLANSSINGVAIASEYTLSGKPPKGYFFNGDAEWFDFGGGLPGIGKNSVTYTYDMYVK